MMNNIKKKINHIFIKKRKITKKRKIAILTDLKQDFFDYFYVYTNYCNFLEESNLIPILLPYTKFYKTILKDIDAILLVGGGIYYKKNKSRYYKKPLSLTNPKRYSFEKKIISYSITHSIPILAICRGAEMIAEFLGAKVIDRDNYEQKTNKCYLNHYNNEHHINLVKNTLLYKMIKKRIVKVNSYHNKFIVRLPHSLKPTAYAEDGVIEAFESRKLKIIAYQFHPERLDKKRRNIFIKPFLYFF